MISQVLKRDGKTLQSFDSSKIHDAVTKAWKGCGEVDDEKIQNVVWLVEVALRENSVADVEKIQDLVEIALMRVNPLVAKAYILYRQKRTEVRSSRRHPDPLAVSSYVHAGKYARYLPELRRREVYLETVQRDKEMHLRKFAHVPGLAEKIEWAFKLVAEKRLLPSMRSMQFGGKAIELNNARGFNCSATFIDRPRAFSEALFLLLSGCGVGYSIQFEHVDKLPALKIVDEKRVVHHTVDDSIEGWADALDALINSYIEGYYLEINFSKIRPAGTPLKTSGGRAPGHLGLKKALKHIRDVLRGAEGRKLRPIECHRILCHAADAVLSGGVRRSAMIALFSLEDSEMMYAKTGNWFKREPWLANANNSVMLKRDDVKSKQFKRIFQMTQEFGEPGFMFCVDYEYATNPCVAGDTLVLTRRGACRIDTLVGERVDVWNGKEWSTVEPCVTGRHEQMVRVELSNRRSLTCTPAHVFYLNDGEETCAGSLQIGDVLEDLEIPEGGDLKGYCSVHVTAVIRCGIASKVYCFTEPKRGRGVFNGILTGQCAEIGLNPKLVINDEVMDILAKRASRGKPMPSVTFGEIFTGWSFCNLCELNAKAFDSFEAFLEAAEAATIIGTLQASYTDFPYLGWVSEVIAEREALLGVGMTGMMDAPHIALNPDYQRKVAAKIVEWNIQYAAQIGIRPAARTTTVKPSGTTSLELGSVGSGHHAHHARRYIRRITADELEVVFQHFQATNPHMCVRKPDGKWVIEFPVEAPEGAVLKEDLTAIQFLEMVKSTQQNWVMPGTARPESSPGLNHNVSNTVQVKPDEWDAVADYLWENREFFTGVSLLPNTGDKDFAFAPNEAIVTEADEARWNQLLAHYKPVDYTLLIEEEDATDVVQEPACAGGACEVPQ